MQNLWKVMLKQEDTSLKVMRSSPSTGKGYFLAKHICQSVHKLALLRSLSIVSCVLYVADVPQITKKLFNVTLTLFLY